MHSAINGTYTSIGSVYKRERVERIRKDSVMYVLDNGFSSMCWPSNLIKPEKLHQLTRCTNYVGSCDLVRGVTLFIIPSIAIGSAAVFRFSVIAKIKNEAFLCKRYQLSLNVVLLSLVISSGLVYWIISLLNSLVAFSVSSASFINSSVDSTYIHMARASISGGMHGTYSHAGQPCEVLPLRYAKLHGHWMPILGGTWKGKVLLKWDLHIYCMGTQLLCYATLMFLPGNRVYTAPWNLSIPVSI